MKDDEWAKQKEKFESMFCTCKDKDQVFCSCNKDPSAQTEEVTSPLAFGLREKSLIEQAEEKLQRYREEFDAAKVIVVRQLKKEKLQLIADRIDFEKHKVSTQGSQHIEKLEARVKELEAENESLHKYVRNFKMMVSLLFEIGEKI